ncbi:uncharacterized protein EV420DRAFT_1553079 [Desarmillaria tabescens]|uniref:Uncharacterized protein n=1 Tax=Armillaria tabescens TaxID=1929756 RepID=A0AA39N2P8_ARMTA|nr:uncharacterized protein EV420DRAFT_1553079 [Desarmillaria tabescens]KAK0455762.1 hypothetical protein EV420DRAFT_1553079 [Desarmillaria tabescens]
MPSTHSSPSLRIQENALYIVCSTLEGHPHSIRSFRLTCTAINVFPRSNATHRSILKRNFSHSAVARPSSKPTSKEYRQLFNSPVYRERRGLDGKEPVDADHMSTGEVLWVLTFMCLDDESMRANTLHPNTFSTCRCIHELVIIKHFVRHSLNMAYDSAYTKLKEYFDTKDAYCGSFEYGE